MAENEFDIIVVGTGCAGLTAAIYTGRYNLKTLVVGKDLGMLALSNDVGNWPGIKQTTGMELLQQMKEHAESIEGVTVLTDEVERLKKEKDGFLLYTSGKKEFKAKALILTLGLKSRKLNIPGEENLSGRGVSYCATCDAPFAKDKIIGVVGGNDSAAEAALLAAEYGQKVYIFYRREALRAQPYLVKKIEENKKIETVFKSNVKEILGEKTIEKVKVDVDGKMKEWELGFLFIEIGAVPQQVLLEELDIEMDEQGFIKCDRKMNTNVEGVFAAGDINADTPMRQAITAAGEGAIAGYSAYMYLTKKKVKA
jgi:thioredoxin reductase (NADPH)